MKKIYVIAGLLLLMTVMVIAEDEIILEVPGGNNDPAENDDANACFSGGVLAGKCSSTDVDQDGDVDSLDRAWMWEAGWRLIRFNYGMIAREDFEPYYLPILPSLSQPEEIVTVNMAATNCRLSDTNIYYDFGAGNYLPTGTVAYQDANCTIPSTAFRGAPVVYSPPGTDALTLCNNNGTFTSVAPPHGDNLYTCVA